MIECKKFTSFSKGTLQGFADIFWHEAGIEMKGLALHMKDGKRWLNMPAKEYIDNGEKKYQPIIFFPDKDKYQRFQQESKKAIDDFCMNNKPTSDEVPF